MKKVIANWVAGATMAAAMGGSPALAATNTAQETANKQLVVAFYDALEAANAAGTAGQQARSIAERFISPAYIQHRDGEPARANAREAFIQGAQAAPPGPPPPAMRSPATTVALMAEDDRVIIVTSRQVPGADGATQPVFIFNMFRIADGKLAEHWDALPAGMMAPPPGASGQRPPR